MNESNSSRVNAGQRSHIVHLYTVNLDVHAKELDACRRVLSADEIARADRFVGDSLSHRWLVSRARLRQVLANHCDTSPDTIEFYEQEFGKPALNANLSDVALHFSISHSLDLAVVAITELAPVGVDVEYERTMPDWAGVASRFFSPHEQAQLADVDTERRQHAFYCCWTRKESVVKATGEGLSARLDSFDVSLLPGAKAEVFADRRGNGTEGRWQMHHFVPKSEYVGAVAIRSTQTIELNYNSCPS